MEELTRQIKKLALGHGAKLVGIAKLLALIVHEAAGLVFSLPTPKRSGHNLWWA